MCRGGVPRRFPYAREMVINAELRRERNEYPTPVLLLHPHRETAIDIGKLGRRLRCRLRRSFEQHRRISVSQAIKFNAVKNMPRWLLQLFEQGDHPAQYRAFRNDLIGVASEVNW